MNTTDDDTEGIRGGKLAEDADPDRIVPPNPADLGRNGVRGDGMADGADLAGRTAPAEGADDVVESGLRGDRLATDA